MGNSLPELRLSFSTYCTQSLRLTEGPSSNYTTNCLFYSTAKPQKKKNLPSIATICNHIAQLNNYEEHDARESLRTFTEKCLLVVSV